MRKSVGEKIAILYRKERSYFAKQLEEYKFGISFLIFLQGIPLFGEITQEELANKIGMDKTSVSKITKKLFNLEYIYIEKDRENKRFKRVGLTKKGKEIIPILESTANSWTEIMSKDLTKEEVEMIYYFLDKMIKN